MLLIFNVCEEIHHIWHSLIKRESTWGKCLWLKLWNKAQVSFKVCVCLIFLLVVFLCWNIVKADFSSLYRTAYPQVKWMFSVAMYSVSLHVCIWFCLSLELRLDQRNSWSSEGWTFFKDREKDYREDTFSFCQTQFQCWCNSERNRTLFLQICMFACREHLGMLQKLPSCIISF